MTLKKQLLNKILFTLVAIALFVAFTIFTNPYSVALPLLIVPFALLGFVIYQLTSAMLLLKKRDQGDSYHEIISISVAFLAVSLLLLKSLHQLTWKDSLLVSVFGVLFWLYISKADFLRK